MANGIFSKLYEMETGEQGPLSFAGRVRAVEGLEGMQPATPPPSSFSPGVVPAPGMGPVQKAPLAPGDPSRVQPYSPHWSTLAGQGLAGLGSAISSGYAAGRGDLQSARQYQQLGENRIQQMGQQARQQAMMRQLSETLPQGIQTPDDMRAAIDIFTRMGGMDPQSAMGFAMQAMQMSQAQQMAQRPDLTYQRIPNEDGTVTLQAIDKRTGQPWGEPLGTGPAAPMVSLQLDPVKQGTFNVFEDVKQRTGDENLARLVVQDKAYEDTISGIGGAEPLYALGTQVDQRSNQDIQTAISSFIEQQAAFDDVVREVGETGRPEQFAEMTQEALTGMASPAFANYETQSETLAVRAARAIEGGRMTDQDVDRQRNRIPRFAEAVRGGEPTEVARRKFDAIMRDMETTYITRFRPEDRAEAKRRFRRYVEAEKQDRTAMRLAEQGDREGALEAALDAAEARKGSGLTKDEQMQIAQRFVGG